MILRILGPFPDLRIVFEKSADSPVFETTSRLPFLSLKLKTKHFFFFLRILQFFKVKVGHTSAWNLRISGHFRYFPPAEVDITEASPIEEGFYTTISRFSPTGCINYA